MAPKHIILYVDPDTEFSLRLSDRNEEVYLDYILCQKPIDKSTYETTRENNILLQLAHHACRRDEKQIVTSTRYILAEVRSNHQSEHHTQ